MRRLVPLLGAALLAGMTGCPSTESHPDSGPPAPPEWRTVVDRLDGTLLSVWGTSDTDVSVVRGPLGNGFKSLVIHYDGSNWKRLDPAGTETYWWVHGTGSRDVWMVGEKGRMTHWDGSAFKE